MDSEIFQRLKEMSEENGRLKSQLQMCVQCAAGRQAIATVHGSRFTVHDSQRTAYCSARRAGLRVDGSGLISEVRAGTRRRWQSCGTSCVCWQHRRNTSPSPRTCQR